MGGVISRPKKLITMFYNTTAEQGEKQKQYHVKTITQKEMVYDFFKQRYGKAYTAEYVHKYLINEIPCLTSIRRSMSELKNQGKWIQKEKVMGLWGHSCYKYQLA